jgi:hypothetical protein
MTKIPFAVLGMRCWKCKKPMPGGLMLPEPLTPEGVGRMLVNMRILAQCQECMDANPSYLEFKEAKELE